MKKTIGTLALLALGLALVLVPAPARAACGVDVSFGQVSGGNAGCGGYCYVQSPGLRATSSIRGSFWGLGGGNPGLSAGVDNGNWQISDATGWCPDLGFGGGVALNGGWAQNANIDGCIESLGTGSKMAVALTDIDATNGNAFFAAACATRDGGAATEFDYTKVGANIVLKQIPGAVITGSTRVGNEASVTIASPNFTSMFYTDNSPGCTLAAVIPKYDVWIKSVARGAAAPTDRGAVAGGWTLASGTGCNLGSPCTVSTACGTTNCDAYFAVSPRFDSGFQTFRVGQNSRLVQAGPVLANPPKVKVIKKQEPG